MNAERVIDDLETALLERAHKLADEYLQRARQSRDQVIQEENERLRLREEREVLAAKAMAERAYRRQVQANELKLQEDLDRFRWGIAQEVLGQIAARLQPMLDDDSSYLPVLRAMLGRAAASIPEQTLVAELNERDHQRLASQWDAFIAEAAAGKQVSLSDEICQCMGGVRVRNVDNTIQVDNTFDGRIERFREQIDNVLMERLFPHGLQMRGVAHG